MKSRAILPALLLCVVGLASADDGQLLRKVISKAPGQPNTTPISEADHVFVNSMKLYVPAQSSNGTLTAIEYYDANGALVETRSEAKPLIGVYHYGPVVTYEGLGFIGHGGAGRIRGRQPRRRQHLEADESVGIR